MPEFDVPGHGSWGAGRPELMGCADVLDPTKPEVYEFLKAFLGEMAAVFALCVCDWFTDAERIEP